MAAVLQPSTAPTVCLSACRASLAAYLRTLWNVSPALIEQDGVQDDLAARPFLADAALHLPRERSANAADAPRDWYRAAAAHATAHRVYSNATIDLKGLPPIAQALLALLEDARVECLASRELPGLRRLWSVWHTATPELGDGFEALMQRLARALLDPHYDDPHPWIAKGRQLFFLDPAAQVLALRQPSELRRVATLLGNDIGQMRLPFHARGYRVEPSYRDDHRWMQPPVTVPVSPTQAPMPNAPRHEPAGAVAFEGESSAAEAPATTRRHAEWDWRIARYRREWCTVRADAAAVGDAAALNRALAAAAPLRERLRQALQSSRRTKLQGCSRERSGPALDLRGLVRRHVARRLGQPSDDRVYRRRQRHRERGSTLLLLDVSVSTSRPFADEGGSLLDAIRVAAALLAHQLHDAGEACAVLGFRSDGRHRVQVQHVKGFDTAADAAMLARLAGLDSALSTRLGAALRHATGLLAPRRGHRTLLLVTDGRPHDIDLHDTRYLIEDARRAVLEAARTGIEVRCIDLDVGSLDAARRIFGPRGATGLATLAALPAAIVALGL